MIWLVLGSIVPSMLICFTGAWLVRLFGPRLGLVDKPGARKIHARAMPTGGGLAIWLGVVTPFAIGQIVLWAIAGSSGGGTNVVLPDWVPTFVATHAGGLLQQSGRLWALLGGGTVLMLLGLVDDRRGLNWKTRILIQALVALVMVRLGWQLSLFVEMPVLTGVVSVLWIVGLVNSFNMLDNMDGLSAGVAAIACSMLAVVMLTVPGAETNNGPQLFVGGFLLVLVGSLMGFLVHNRPPARLFMGDAGSYLIGYFIAMATLSATFAGDNLPRHAILAPLCVLAVPLYDTASVLFIRIRAGRSPFEGDKSHFSHRLVELGMSKTQAVATIYLTTATCGLGALLLHQVNLFGAAIVLLLIGCVLLLVAILETTALKSSTRRGKKTGKRGRSGKSQN